MLKIPMLHSSDLEFDIAYPGSSLFVTGCCCLDLQDILNYPLFISGYPEVPGKSKCLRLTHDLMSETWNVSA